MHVWCKKCCGLKNKERYSLDKWKDYYIKNKDKRDAYHLNYIKNNKSIIKDKNKSYYDSHKGNSEAHSLVQDSILSGKLLKPDLCEICSQDKRLDAHHEDYNFPLNVVWLCRSCHKKHHSNNFKELSTKIEYIFKMRINNEEM